MVSLKIACENKSYEKSENLHEEQHTSTIKFCLKLKKTVIEMKEMLKAAYNKSTMSQASVYHWYNVFKSGRKSVELMDGPEVHMTVLTNYGRFYQIVVNLRLNKTKINL